ncbi:MAG: Nudix family hydrolase [Betaproteobacteria bacterium]|nr:Nudix family hydrolase [Betaproteobacteria bacterium]
MTEKVTDVAVAIFLQPDGSFLLSSRPEGKPYPGYWEFPGGKIEPGESVRDALVRELVEELNVTITAAYPWFTFLMRYTHATVRLHCWRALAWHGDMRGMEGQAFAWQSIDNISVAPTLPGCVPIFKALALPTTYWITNAAEMGAAAYLDALRKSLETPVSIQIREKAMHGAELEDFSMRVLDIARPRGCKVLVNADVERAHRIGADGVHLTAAQVRQIEMRPDLPLVGASAHDRAELDAAAAFGCDFAVLGPVHATRTHPGVEGMGWARFAALALDSPIPVFAIGGLEPSEADCGIEHGAHGLAMQRGIFT